MSGQENKSGNQGQPIVIAHRGASGYLPEHTLAATALAYGMGADFIEQDVVLTKDNVPVVVHDITLDTVTDVATRFPDRARQDGQYYAIDFTLSELKKLQVHERVDIKSGKRVYEDRFPIGRSKFEIATLAEAIELIQGLNQSSKKVVGIYPEIKKPAWHRQQGKDISRIVLKVLEKYGYLTNDDPVYLQCFDATELIRVRHELGCNLKLIQLIGSDEWKESSTSYVDMITEEGIQRVAEYADGIGPWMPHLIDVSESESPSATSLCQFAKKFGLKVHPFTFRADALPKHADSFERLVEMYRELAKVDGFFTDHPDLLRRILE